MLVATLAWLLGKLRVGQWQTEKTRAQPSKESRALAER